MTDRPAKGNNMTEPVDGSSNKVTGEGRHKGVPPQVVRGPSVVAKKAGGHITGPRGLAREGGEGCAKLSAVAQVVAQQRAELDALSAGPSSLEPGPLLVMILGPGKIGPNLYLLISIDCKSIEI